MYVRCTDIYIWTSGNVTSVYLTLSGIQAWLISGAYDVDRPRSCYHCITRHMLSAKDTSTLRLRTGRHLISRAKRIGSNRNMGAI
jgi:hypothetical protein